TVSHIDDKGISFSSSVSEATFISHDQIKALELMPDAAARTIAPAKRERLLTLPRMQRDNPPTHLIRSVDGDYLRGPPASMDDTQLEVEVRLESKTIPRDRVARIIWLHAQELRPAGPPSGQSERSGTRVQIVPHSGNRLTFWADQVDGGAVLGQSELLGS